MLVVVGPRSTAPGDGPTPNVAVCTHGRADRGTYGGQGKAAGYVPPTALLRIRKSQLRRFPPPWTVEELDACFVVRDGYFDDKPPTLATMPANTSMVDIPIKTYHPYVLRPR
jgi:hypothetical protein